MKNFSVIELIGLNQEDFLNEITKEKIILQNVKKPNYNKLQFTIEENQVTKLFALRLAKCYNLSVIKKKGPKQFLHNVKTNIGLTIGIVLSLIFLIFNSCFITNIQISGLDRLTRQDVQFCLKENNINNFSLKQNVDPKMLESTLISKFENISLASVVIKGTTLVVNIKERIYVPIMDGETDSIIAPVDCKIKSMTVSSGTILKNIGDSVKAGEVIVGNYHIDDEGEKTQVKATAVIKINTFITETQEVFDFKDELVLTGNTENIKTYYFGKTKLFSGEKSTGYKFYEKQESTKKMFSLLPFFQHTVTYNECEVKRTAQDYEDVKESIKKELKYKAYEKLSDNSKVESEQYYFTKLKNSNIIMYKIMLEQTL